MCKNDNYSLAGGPFSLLFHFPLKVVFAFCHWLSNVEDSCFYKIGF